MTPGHGPMAGAAAVDSGGLRQQLCGGELPSADAGCQGEAGAVALGPWGPVGPWGPGMGGARGLGPSGWGLGF